MQAKKVVLVVMIALTVIPHTSLLAQDATGRWKGRIEPTNHSAEIELELQRAGAVWTATLTYRAGPDGGPLPIEELRVDDDSVFVRTTLEGADMSLELAIEDDLMLGSVRVTENGSLLVEGPAGLARASDASGQMRLLDWLNEQGESIDAERRDAAIEGALQLLLANYMDLGAAEGVGPRDVA